MNEETGQFLSLLVEAIINSGDMAAQAAIKLLEQGEKEEEVRAYLKGVETSNEIILLFLENFKKGLKNERP